MAGGEQERDERGGCRTVALPEVRQQPAERVLGNAVNRRQRRSLECAQARIDKAYVQR
jgi:hypothetical protein